MRDLSKHIRTALLVWAVVASRSEGVAQQSAAPKRVLVLHWEDREHPANEAFDQQFHAALESAAPGGIEYYSEYLETNKFPGENQSQLLSDYLRRKYADRTIDVLVAHSSPSLDFLLKRRSGLFPHTPIVFATERPVAARVAKEADATGIVYLQSYRDTVDLALRLHPGTKQLCIISGTPSHDKAFESIARNALDGYKDKVAINYLTDFTPEELTLCLRDLPKDSLVLYVWQQTLNEQGRVVGSQDILARISTGANIPIYGMSFANIGLGIVGGYVYTHDANIYKLVPLTLRVANGARAADIPVEKAPAVPMFDWHQLQRWGVSEERLPVGSIIRFRELTVWQQYKWRIVAAIVVFALQALLIGALLVERQRVRRAQQRLQENEEHLEQLVQQRTAEAVEARDEALAANRAKTAFLANMSHELRTPLNAILGFSAMARADTGLSEEHRHDLDIVRNSGEHLLVLIDDVLDMAKIEAGRIVVERRSFDLHAMVVEMTNMLREHAQAKGLELLLDLPATCPQFVRSDPGKLRQVLTNLVGNAIKYTDQGRVVVSVATKAGENSQDVILLFDVEDTGIGIAFEDQQRIFDPFVQAGSVRTTKGTGLGLSISRHFVQLLGGNIHVDSTLRRGSHFHVEVPTEMGTESEVMTETPDAGPVIGLEPGQPEYRVLIVEDHKENLLLLQRILETAGFQVRGAGDGAQALEMFGTWQPHFIWMDLRLPVMNGVEAARRIRKMGGGTKVKIVALTASAFTSQREEVLAAGLDDFLRKPYRRGEIFDCLARHLGVRYTHRKATPVAVESPPARLCPEELAALPEELRTELENALIALEIDRIVRLISQISEQNAALGRVLSQLADSFSYTPILRALEDCKKKFNEARV